MAAKIKTVATDWLRFKKFKKFKRFKRGGTVSFNFLKLVEPYEPLREFLNLNGIRTT